MATLEMERFPNPMKSLGVLAGRDARFATHLSHLVVVHSEIEDVQVQAFTDGYVDGLLQFFRQRGINLGKNTANRAEVEVSLEMDRWISFKRQHLMREGFLKGLTQREPSSEAARSLRMRSIDANDAHYPNGYKLGAFARFVKDEIPPIEQGNPLEGLVSLLPYNSFKDGFNGRPKKEMNGETDEEQREKALYDTLYEAGLSERITYDKITND